MSAWAARAPALLAALAACGDPRFTAEERWDDPSPDLRIAILRTQPEPDVRVLVGDDPYSVSLAKALAGGTVVDIWVLGYSVDALAERFPSLADHSAAEIAGLVSVQVGGTFGAPIPRAGAVLSASIVRGGPTEVVYQQREWIEWEALKIDLRLVLPTNVLCTSVSATPLEAPAGVSFSGVTTTSSGTPILAGVAGADSRIQIHRLEGDEFSLLGTLDAPGPIRDRLGWDPKTETGYLVSADGRLVRFDQLGQSLAVPSVPVIDPPAQWRGVNGVSVGTDGSVFAASFYLFELRGAAWEAITPVPNQRHPIELLRVVDRRRIFLFNACWVNLFVDLEPSQLLFADYACAAERGRSMRDIGADGDSVVVVGDRSRVSILSTGGAPLDLTGAFDETDLHAAVPLHGGRHLVAGDNGWIAVWVGSAWCPLPLDPTLRFRAAVATPRGDEAYVLGEPVVTTAGLATPVVRVRVPLP
ncbi:MAG: hypothetical protein IT384_16545 [Deltaproteobacteria bacterium]|nr:hypothetical protein [Deltaproteobacteria bacterium]